MFCLYLVQNILNQNKGKTFYIDLQQVFDKKVYFSRPKSEFPALFNANLIFKDFSRKLSMHFTTPETEIFYFKCLGM